MHAIKALQKRNSSKYRLKRKRKRKFITLRKKERGRVLVFVIAPSYSFLPASLVLLLHFCLVIHHLPKMPSLASAGQLHTKRPHEPLGSLAPPHSPVSSAPRPHTEPEEEHSRGARRGGDQEIITQTVHITVSQSRVYNTQTFIAVL
jgi:hypothetical protein